MPKTELRIEFLVNAATPKRGRDGEMLDPPLKAATGAVVKLPATREEILDALTQVLTAGEEVSGKELVRGGISAPSSTGGGGLGGTGESGDDAGL